MKLQFKCVKFKYFLNAIKLIDSSEMNINRKNWHVPIVNLHEHKKLGACFFGVVIVDIEVSNDSEHSNFRNFLNHQNDRDKNSSN